VAELVDARDLKSLGASTPCRFKSGPRHQQAYRKRPFERKGLFFGFLDFSPHEEGHAFLSDPSKVLVSLISIWYSEGHSGRVRVYLATKVFEEREFGPLKNEDQEAFLA
jgi:hypothetical protein